MRLNFGVSFFVVALTSVTTFAEIKPEIAHRLLSKQVPADALRRLTQFIDENNGREFVIDTYTCKDKPPESVKPCWEGDRSDSTQTVTLKSPHYAVIVDYSKPSSVKRLYFLDLTTGEVSLHSATHGIGSGESDWATKFSNIKDSKQTSLGFYLTGETYNGKYGESLRMYGLEKSNDQAYNRDIVMHGAWYAEEDFKDGYNKKTGYKFGRLGLSWGCPALAKREARKLIPNLKNGALIYHYHAELADQTTLGSEVHIQRPLSRPSYFTERKTSRPPKRPKGFVIPKVEESPSEPSPQSNAVIIP